MGKQSLVGKLKGLIYLFGGLIFVFAAFGISAPAAADGPLAGYWRYTNYLGNIYCAELEYDGGQEHPYTLKPSDLISAGNYKVEVVENEDFLVKRSGGLSIYSCWVWKIVSNDRLENVCEYDSFYELGPGDCPYCYGDTKMTRITDTGDGDSDGVMNGCDNCPTVSNPDQTDSNWDGVGDVCELGDGSACDFDAECLSNNCVNAVTAGWPDTHVGACCPVEQYWVVNHCESCTDADGDEVCEDPSVSNVADNCPTVYNPDQLDSDGDGIGDACEGPQPEPYQPVPAKKLFKTKFVEFNLLFDTQGNSYDAECVSGVGCKVSTVQLEDLKIHGQTLRYAPYDKPWGVSGSCYTYVRTRSGGVKKIEVECSPPT